MPTPWHGIGYPPPPPGGGRGYPLGIPHYTIDPRRLSSFFAKKKSHFFRRFSLTIVWVVKRKVQADAKKYLKKYLQKDWRSTFCRLRYLHGKWIFWDQRRVRNGAVHRVVTGWNERGERLVWPSWRGFRSAVRRIRRLIFNNKTITIW